MSIGNSLSASYYRLTIYPIGQQEWQADRTFSIRSNLFDRQQCSHLGCHNALRCASQESYHQADEGIPIGSCLYFSTGLQGTFSNSFIHTDSILASIILALTNFHCGISTPAHWEGPEAQVPMPPSPVNQRGKAPGASAPRQNAREQQCLLPLQDRRFWWSLLLLPQKLRHNRCFPLSQRRTICRRTPVRRTSARRHIG